MTLGLPSWPATLQPPCFGREPKARVVTFNVLLTFTAFVNFIFHKKLDEFVIIYIDDILVYSKIVEEHVKHLKYMLSKFQKNQLVTNKVKSEFAQKEMDFLGHILSLEGVRLDLKKLEAVND